jgi:hypothetical protein
MRHTTPRCAMESHKGSKLLPEEFVKQLLPRMCMMMVRIERRSAIEGSS